jgi:hypothetical protein
MSNNKLKYCGHLLAALAAAALLAASAASAQVWTEDGDAGDLLGSAQVTLGVGGLATIDGVLSEHDDVDLYCIQLTATPPAWGCAPTRSVRAA